MLPASQKLVEGIELRAVAHVLVHVQDLCQDATTQTHPFSPQRATLQAKREKMGHGYDPLGIRFLCHLDFVRRSRVRPSSSHGFTMFAQPFIQQQGQIFSSQGINILSGNVWGIQQRHFTSSTRPGGAAPATRLTCTPPHRRPQS